MADVSVIVPVRNGAAYLEASVESALDQRGLEVEVLVVDDASGDSTPEIAAGIAAADPRVILIRRESCGGPGAARNDGLDAASAPLVTFLDSGDQFLPFALREMAVIMEESGADIVYGRHGRLDGFGILRPVAHLDHFAGLGPDLRQVEDAAIGFGAVTGKLLRRDLVDRAHLRFPELCGGEDTVFSLRSWHAARKIVASRGLVLVRRPLPRPAGDPSLTEIRSLVMARDLLACAAEIGSFCAERGLEPIRRKGVPIVVARALLHAAQIGDREEKAEAIAEIRRFVEGSGMLAAGIEGELGFTLAELRALDPAGLRESLVLYRRARAGLLRDLEAARSGLSARIPPESRSPSRPCR